MAFEMDPNARYDQPVVFGASRLPDVTVMSDFRNAAIPFLTERSAIERYLPRFFELAGEPVVTVSSSHNGGVDWMGDRQYNVVRVQANVTYRGSETVTGPYSLVIWESDAKPVIAGRELQGYAKIVGEIPDHVRTEDSLRFELREYGTRLISGMISDLKPLTSEVVTGLNKVGERAALGWKFIPSLEGGADVDYPVKLISSGEVLEAWSGNGELHFDDPTWQQAPGSAHIIEALKTLPILEYRPAVVTHSRVTLPRNAAQRLR